jgi:DNA-binding transcriptional MerR regulator
VDVKKIFELKAKGFSVEEIEEMLSDNVKKVSSRSGVDHLQQQREQLNHLKNEAVQLDSSFLKTRNQAEIAQLIGLKRKIVDLEQLIIQNTDD